MLQITNNEISHETDVEDVIIEIKSAIDIEKEDNKKNS